MDFHYLPLKRNVKEYIFALIDAFTQKKIYIESQKKFRSRDEDDSRDGVAVRLCDTCQWRNQDGKTEVQIQILSHP